MRTAHTLKQRGDQAIQNAGQLNQDLRQQTVQGHKQAFEDVYGKTVGALKLSELRAPTGATPEQLSEIEAYNNGIRGLRTEAEKIALGTSDPRSIASASLKAAAYDFHQLNFKPVVMVDTFSGDKIIKFLSTLKQLDTSLRIRTFSLYASDDVLKKRLDGRPAGEFKDFEISRKLNLDVLKNTVDDEHLIDTSCLLPAQTAELIYREISGSK